MSGEILRELEEDMEQAKQQIELGSALGRLMSNRDFRAVVLDGYLKREAVRLVHKKAEPGMQTDSQQRQVLSQLDAIGHLHQYLLGIPQSSDLARKAYDAAEATREQILAEG